MVEEFELMGDMIPTYGEVMRAILERELPGVSYVPDEPIAERVSKTIRYRVANNPPTFLQMHLDIEFDSEFNPILMSNKIAFFSRFGSNFDAVEILELVCDKYGCGYRTLADGGKVLRDPGTTRE